RNDIPAHTLIRMMPRPLSVMSSVLGPRRRTKTQREHSRNAKQPTQHLHLPKLLLVRTYGSHWTLLCLGT
ncbi:MAG TPA: hypothetical protein VJY33_13950, partial [Isosphaeraceae bacterium]|nr:hypothetical protein [Isosphaeraceae bacterium]